MKKLKYYLLFLSICLLVLRSFSQNNITPEWLINSTGDNWGVVTDQVIDNDGMIYQTGNFDAEIGFGKNSGKITGHNSLFVTKVNKKGSVEWIRKISGSVYCSANSICVGNEGLVYVCGNYRGEINEGNVSFTSQQKKNAFILKLDAKGKLEWGTGINGLFRNQHTFLSIDDEGNVIFAGSYLGELILNNNQYNSRYYCDIAIAKLNDKGEITASQVLEGKDDDLVNDLIITPKGEIILTGSFEKDLITGDKTLVSNGQKDVFLVVMDDNLQFASARQMGGYYDDYGKALAFDNGGNLLLAGSFSGSVQFSVNEILESSGKLDVFLTKFDLTGEPIWSKCFGGAANDYVNSMDINGLNDIYLIGSYRGTIESGSDKIESEEFSTDIFLVKYSADGDFKFIESFGGENHDFGRTICLNNSNSIYVSGNYSDDLAVLGAKTGKSIGENFFLSELYDCATVPKIHLPADTTVCANEFVLSVNNNYEQYFWNGQPGNHELLVDSTGWYSVEAIDKHGCITGDTIFVQLNKPPGFNLGGPFVLMKGESLILNAPEGMTDYLWNDNSSNSFLCLNTAINEPGENLYWVRVVDDKGCSSFDETIVFVCDESANDLADSAKNIPIEERRANLFSNIALDNTIEKRLSIVDSTKYQNQEFSAEIFPNPANKELIVAFKNLNDEFEITIQIYNDQGQLVFNDRILNLSTNINFKINVSHFLNGSYLLRINRGNYAIIYKIVIQH